MWQPTPVFLPGIPWTEKPGRLQSTGSDTTEHARARAHTHTHTYMTMKSDTCSQTDPLVAGKRAIKGILARLTKSTVLVNCAYGSGLHRELVRYSFQVHLGGCFWKRGAFEQ